MNRVTNILVDWAMFWVAGMLAYMATESWAWVIGAIVLTVAYSIWCHRQGALAFRRRTIASLTSVLQQLKQLEQHTRR